MINNQIPERFANHVYTGHRIRRGAQNLSRISVSTLLLFFQNELPDLSKLPLAVFRG